MEKVLSNSEVKPNASFKQMKRFEKRKPQDNLVKNVLALNWISAVTKGGKRQRVSAFVIVGDGRGSVGYCLAKAKEVSDAVKKSIDKASSIMFRVPLRDNRTFYHDMEAKYCSTRICLRSAPEGSGIISGEVVRLALEALGVKDAVVKVLGSTNPYNVIKALFKALFAIQSPRVIAARRGVPISQVLGVEAAKIV
ncbi:MAG: 30S ribosomal protein S5 [Alphaproteobacteria bacterium]|nr:MAG: 30S ribosomal protein S5 [Alphaproteobacteria bacterium]